MKEYLQFCNYGTSFMSWVGYHSGILCAVKLKWFDRSICALRANCRRGWSRSLWGPNTCRMAPDVVLAQTRAGDPFHPTCPRLKDRAQHTTVVGYLSTSTHLPWGNFLRKIKMIVSRKINKTLHFWGKQRLIKLIKKLHRWQLAENKTSSPMQTLKKHRCGIQKIGPFGRSGYKDWLMAMLSVITCALFDRVIRSFSLPNWFCCFPLC